MVDMEGSLRCEGHQVIRFRRRCEMIKLKRHGGERGQAGNYWNFSTGERVHLEKEGILPGDGSVTYLKCHPAALLLVGPFMGLVYAIFLPLIGIGMLIWVIGEKLAGGVLENIGKAAVFSWNPSEAYLAGRKRKAKNKDEAEKR
jgi:hypothetical protein